MVNYFFYKFNSHFFFKIIQIDATRHVGRCTKVERVNGSDGIREQIVEQNLYVRWEPIMNDVIFTRNEKKNIKKTHKVVVFTIVRIDA